MSDLDRRRLIVIVHTDHPNDAETAKPKRRAFAHYGYEVVELSIQSPQAGAQLAALLRDRGNELFCFVSDNFHAAAIRDPQNRLVHDALGIPLVVYLHDHPLYFADHWTPALDGAIVFAPGRDLLDSIGANFPVKVTGVVNSAFFAPPIERTAPSFEDFSARENRILAPMNLALWGMTLDQTWQRIKELPQARRERAAALADAARSQWDRPLHEVALSDAQAVSPMPPGDQILVLNFLKLWRRNAMIRSLIDLPLLVSSEYVPADLEFKYPAKFTLLTMAQTTPLYSRYRFVLNSFPLLVDALHERVTGAFYGNAALVTDRNRAMMGHFADESELLYYDYEAPGVVEKIARYVEDPAAAFALTVRSHERRSEGDFESIAAFGDLIEAVKRKWAARNSIPAAR